MRFISSTACFVTMSLADELLADLEEVGDGADEEGEDAQVV